MTLSLLVGLALVVAAILIGTFQTQLNSASHKETAAVSPIKIPTRRDGVLFFSDGAKGVARESALELAKQGYHVLVGVKSEDEKRSFAFESRKGLEIILYDIADPSTLANLVYRLRQIKRDLDRPTVGVILNVAGKFRLSAVVSCKLQRHVNFVVSLAQTSLKTIWQRRCT